MSTTNVAEPMLRLRGVGHSYPGAPDVLRRIDLQLGHGELAFLTGPSGAGKSTLLRIIALSLRPSQGDVWVDGRHLARLGAKQVAAHRRRVGVVFQNARLLADRSVFDNVALPLLIQGHSGADIGRRVRGALDAVGLLRRERMYPLTLSGGEQQRVAIARAVVARPLLLLADEPTGNLDPALAREVMNLFLRFNAVGVTVLVATHALGLIGELPYRRLHLEDGVLHPAATPA